MNLLQLARGVRRTEDRYSLGQYINDLNAYGLTGLNQSYSTTDNSRPTERSDSPFEHWVQQAYKRNGVVFACQVARLRLFCEARFQFQRMNDGRPGDLYGSGYGTSELSILERPWPNGSTRELLARMIQDVDLAGNAFIRRTGPLAERRLERLRPDWVDIVLSSDNPDLINAEVIGYMFWPGGQRDNKRAGVALTRDEVAHWSPLPDPIATYRGMSWLSPVLREIQADGAATDHKQKFFDNAATPNLAVKFDPSVTPEKFKLFKEMMDDAHKGAYNAYKTLYLGGGADATVIGTDFKQMDFRAVQGAGETRIAAAAGVPPVIVGLSEGLQAATYSNYAQARRRFADMTTRPDWGSCADALSTIVKVPSGSRLWYDDRHIPALQEDEKDAADIEAVKASTINTLVAAGFEPGSVVEAVTAQDMTLLTHTGLMSVQLLAPGQSKNGTTNTNGADAPAEGVKA